MSTNPSLSTVQVASGMRSGGKEPAQTFCFVLPWPFEFTGGVNQVVNSLLTSFSDDSAFGLAPIALQLCWDSPKPEAGFYRGVPHSLLWLRFPYEQDKPLRSVLSFFWHAPASMLKLRRYVREHAISVINFHYPDLRALNFLLLRDLKFFQGKVLLSLHGSDIRSAHQGSRLYKWFWRRLLRRADAVIACSEGLREEILMLEPCARSVTIYNGIDVDLFARNSGLNFQLPSGLQGRKIIINVASFEYRKGHDVLLAAFERVVLRHSDAALLLVGKSGPESSQVKRRIEAAGLESSVFVLEDVPHFRIFDLLSAATLFVFATRWRKGVMGEGFALAILEAAAARLPVVATGSCGVEELIENGKTGRVVPLEDAEALASSVCELLDEPETARRMAGRLHELVRKQFTWKEAAAKYASLCK